MDKTLSETVIDLEQDFISGTGTLMSKYVRTDLYDDINTIYAYLESKHTSGEYDSMGREKPFFNIVVASRNIYFRATDLDRKDILLIPKNEKSTVSAFLLSVYLHNWMRKAKFGTFLNNWGMELAGFNSAVCKFVEKDGELVSSVVPWSRLIVDQVNFYDNPQIEILELNEAQMRDRGYDEKVIKELRETKNARELTNKQKKDNKNNYYKVYEVHGVFPLSYLTDKDKDDETYVQQMHVLTVLEKTRRDEKKEFTLYRGKEEKSPYLLTSLMPSTDGSISLNGSVKNLFQAQWMINHTKKAIKDQLDLASKLIFQTADGNYVGQNALSAIETGDILIHAPNMPLTQLANNSHDVTALMNFGTEWKQVSSEINGISDAMLGVAPKAGTAWRQVEATLQENHSLFEIMTENKGLDIEEMLTKFILPFLKKKMNNADEISATLDMHGIKQIEDRYIKNLGVKNYNDNVKQIVKETGDVALAQQSVSLEDEKAKVKQSLSELGNQRFFKPSKINWKEELKDTEYDVDIIVTDESKNTKEIMQTLNTALNVMANPNYSQNPQAQLVINKILTMTGHITPMELASLPEPVTVPQGGEVAQQQLPVNQTQ